MWVNAKIFMGKATVGRPKAKKGSTMLSILEATALMELGMDEEDGSWILRIEVF